MHGLVTCVPQIHNAARYYMKQTVFYRLKLYLQECESMDPMTKGPL